MRIVRRVLLGWAVLGPAAIGTFAQSWTLDEAFGNGGEISWTMAEWGVPICLVPWTDGSWAAAMEMYDATGEVSTSICHAKPTGDCNCWTLPDPTFRVADLLTWPEDDWLRVAGTRYTADDSLGLVATIEIFAVDEAGTFWQGFGESNGRTELEFISTFQELNEARWDTLNGETIILLSGMSLDNCCIHQEIPVLAALDANGVPLATFGHAGRVAIDLPNVGNYEGNEFRHDVGGVFHCAEVTDSGQIIAAGAFSNTAHYETLAIRLDAGGQLDTTFADGGIHHLNGSNGDNHWIADIHESPNGDLLLLVDHHLSSDLEPSVQLLRLTSGGSTLAWETTACNDSPWMPLPHAFGDAGAIWTFGFNPVTGTVSPVATDHGSGAFETSCNALETNTTTFDPKIGYGENRIGLIGRQSFGFTNNDYLYSIYQYQENLMTLDDNLLSHDAYACSEWAQIHGNSNNIGKDMFQHIQNALGQLVSSPSCNHTQNPHFQIYIIHNSSELITKRGCKVLLKGY